MKLISSQRYLDQEIVDTKIANSDFIVQVSPEFAIGDEVYQVIMDGHHSYHAAVKSGNTPEFIVQNAMDNDCVQLIEDNKIEDFLEQCWVDSEYYDVITGENCF